MKYREFGNTGWQVSEIGYGPEHLDGKPYELVEAVTHEVLDQGINIMDCFMPGEEIRRFLGKALGSRRKDMFIQGQIGSVDINKQYDISRDLDTCKRYFDDLLKHLNTDYIDIGLLYFIDSDEDFSSVFNSQIIDYARDLKRQGMIKVLGFTSHNPRTALRVIKTGLVESMMFSTNLAFDMTPADKDIWQLEHFREGEHGIDPLRTELYQLCERMNIPITVMKAYAAGKLLSKDLSPFDQARTSGQCIHYAQSRPSVRSVLLGFDQVKHVKEAVDYYKLKEEERDYTGLMKSFQGDFSGRCEYCSHCQPCPVEIDIAGVHRYLDAARLDTANVPAETRKGYESLGIYASECIGCGECELRCPFGVEVIEDMAEAASYFGK